MVSGIWGKKVGMTQVFSNDVVIPVTVIDVSDWVVTGIKTKDRDGYNAIQVGCLRERFSGQKPSASWIQKLKHYFSAVREVPVAELPDGIAIGQPADLLSFMQEGEQVNVFGTMRGRGFAGVMKRWNFTGGVASHGSMLGRRPGSIGHMRARGRVIKGKKLPGHMGATRRAVRNLAIVKIEKNGPIILVKGAVPGHAGSLVFVQRQEK